MCLLDCLSTENCSTEIKLVEQLLEGIWRFVAQRLPVIWILYIATFRLMSFKN